MLKERVAQEEEEAKENKNKFQLPGAQPNKDSDQYNYRTYAMVLMIKAERCRKMHDNELALRSMYKAQRALRACPEQEPALMAQWYEQMAGIMIRNKELVQANEYLHMSRALQLEQSKKDHEKAEKEANEKLERLLRLQSELMKHSTKARIKAKRTM